MATITVPQVVPSPVEDAEALMKAFQGWGTDEQAVIYILAHRDAAQRKLIRLAYEEKYNESLTQRLQSELSGDFQTAMSYWILDPVERQAVIANAATKCIDEEYPVIVEIACANSPAELLKLKQAYHALYKRSLEEDVAAVATGNLRDLLLALVGTYRYDGDEVNGGLAKSEAKIIHKAVGNGSITDHGELTRILGTRSKAQLVATFNYFSDEHSTTVTKALLHGEDPTGYTRALRIAARCIADTNKYLVKVLRSAMRSSGTDEESLTRVVVMHAENDLRDIKEEFHKRASVTLEQAVAKETSGDYKTFIMALVGSQ
ncbi:annexin-like protein RJ4 [Lolium rigidum]|uniref:annexin-like protein RJ4 n=1 Tax=Lolium rigidum TaxID=89674 RepID=UPI001F5C1D0E|nr:annexin-like protein RJ4 [Lolium rigidum]